MVKFLGKLLITDFIFLNSIDLSRHIAIELDNNNNFNKSNFSINHNRDSNHTNYDINLLIYNLNRSKYNFRKIFTLRIFDINF